MTALRLLCLVFLASMTTVSSAQLLETMTRLTGPSMQGPVMVGTSGRVFVNLANGPQAGPTPTYFDVAELIRDTVPYASIREFGPFRGTDVNGSGSRDLVRNLGSVRSTTLIDASTANEASLDMVAEGVIPEGANPADVLITDVDGDGLDDCVANFGEYVKISYGDSSSPFTQQSIVHVQDGLTEVPADRAIQMGMMQGAFCLLKEVFEEIPGETFSYLQLDVYSAEDIANRADTVRRDSTQVKIDGFEVGDGVALQGENHWHWWRASDNQDIHTSFDGIELIDADPTFRSTDGQPFVENGVLGQVRRLDEPAGIISLNEPIVTVRTALAQGPIYMPVIEIFEVLDERSMRVEHKRSYSMATSDGNTLGRISIAVIPDFGGDGIYDVISGYFAGEGLVDPTFDIYLSEGIINSVDDQRSELAYEVRQTSTGWRIIGLNAAALTAAPLFDLQGRQIGTARIDAADDINIVLQQDRPRGLVWTTINGVAIRLQ